MCPHFCIMMVFLYFCVIILHVNRCYNEKALKPKSLCQEECKNAVNDITILNIFFGGGGGGGGEISLSFKSQSWKV